MPANDVGRGNILYDAIVTLALTPVAVAANTSAEQSFALKGIQVGDHVDVNCLSAQTNGIGIVNCRVSAPDTLTVQFSNSTAGSLSPATASYLVNVNRAVTPASNFL
jgi:hypothetical protein